MRWWVLLLVCSCNSVFGLDGTSEIEATVDVDRDGVADELDNCPDIANADQNDEDDDAIGDACDHCDHCTACDRGPDHDEDGDKLPDGCDNCPALANADQANRDGDDLGDACDADDAIEHRLLFDGFGDLADDWLQSGARWVVTGDDVGPVENTMPGVTKTLQHATIVIPGGTRWVFEAGLVPPPLDHKVGLYSGDSAFCFLEHRAAGDWQILASTTRGPGFAATFDTTIRLRMTPTGPAGAQYVACSIPGVASQADALLELVYPIRPLLVTPGDGPTFRYVELIGE